VELSFVHLCDTHITDPASAEILAAGVPAINALAPDFVVFGGDLANHGDPASYAAFKGALSGLAAPARFVIGNHDMLGGKPAFEDWLGPLNYAFDAGGYHVLCLDSTGRTSLTYGGLWSGATVSWLIVSSPGNASGSRKPRSRRKASVLRLSFGPSGPRPRSR